MSLVFDMICLFAVGLCHILRQGPALFSLVILDQRPFFIFYPSCYYMVITSSLVFGIFFGCFLSFFNVLLWSCRSWIPFVFSLFLLPLTPEHFLCYFNTGGRVNNFIGRISCTKYVKQCSDENVSSDERISL